MLFIKPGVFTYHLRFDPDAELESETMNPLREAGDAARKLFQIALPVTESTELIRSSPKPAVVHDEHLDAELLTCTCDLHKLLFIEVDHRRFPVVEEYRTALILELSRNQEVPYDIMIMMA